MKLFCIPYAGSGASTYGPWKRRFKDVATVSPIQLPGREEQCDLPFFTDVDEAVRHVVSDIMAKADGTYAIFGHSMGALLAYESTHRLESLGFEPPRALIVSGFPAPSIYKPRLTVDALERNGYQELKTLLGDTFTTMLEDEQLFEYATRTMRADVSLCESYQFAPRQRLAMPVYAFGANADPLCEPGELTAWAEHCDGSLSIKTFDGDHFYFKGNKVFELELERAISRCS